MSDIEIVEWNPTPELRWHTPDSRYVPPKLQRKFICKTSDGLSGEVWAEVHPDDTFRRIATITD